MNLTTFLFILIVAGASARGAEAAGGQGSSNLPPNAAAVMHSSVSVTQSGMQLPQSISQWVCAAVLIGIVCGLLFFLLHRSRKSHSNDAKELTSAQLGVIAVAVGASFGFGGAMLSKHDPILDLIVAAVVSVLVIQIAETLRSHHLSKRMQSLERALDSATTYARLDHQLNHLAAVSSLLQKHPGARPLFDEFLADAYNELNDSLELFSAGTINVNDPARELTFNKDCLLHLAHKEVWAISYQDGPFWDEPEGKDFLALHDEKITAGVTIHRVFLLKNDEIANQKAIIEAQIEKRIHCRILLLDSPSNHGVKPEDFVVYDEVFVRAANLVAEGPTTTLKEAVLSCDTRKVRLYLQKRNDFKTRSEPAEDVFKRLVPPTAKAIVQDSAAASFQSAVTTSGTIATAPVQPALAPGKPS